MVRPTRPRSSRPAAPRGFTLAEILVSVGILIAILVVAGRVFQTAQQVSNIGNAAADVLQETAAIEKQIRADVARMSSEGVLAIHSVEVRNDQRLVDWETAGSEGPRPGLINPTLDPAATIRCDQLVFFTDGISRIKQYGSDGYLAAGNEPDWYPKLLGEGSMVYYGHAVQFEDQLKGCNVNEPLVEDPPYQHGHDVDYGQLSEPITPWYDGGRTAAVPTVYRRYATPGDFDITYATSSGPEILGTQPEARKWILARQETLFGDDDNRWPGYDNKRIYMSRAFGVKSVFPVDPRFNSGDDDIGFSPEPLIQAGRVDLAASRIGAIREALSLSRNPDDPEYLMAYRPWDATDEATDYYGTREHARLDQGIFGDDDDAYQREMIKSLVSWPRAEHRPPSENRFDQHLSNHALGSACSSFIVEWTWDEGVGETDTVYIDPQTGRRNGQTYPGLVIDPADSWNGDPDGEPLLGQRWFGLYDADRRVTPFGSLGDAGDTFGWEGFVDLCADDDKGMGSSPPAIVRSDSIEEAYAPPSFGEVPREYWAVFGLNRQTALLPVDQSDMSDGYPDRDPSYTPWPTALRFTMVLHDPKTNLENGQQVQFVVKLPERCQ